MLFSLFFSFAILDVLQARPNPFSNTSLGFAFRMVTQNESITSCQFHHLVSFTIDSPPSLSFNGDSDENWEFFYDDGPLSSEKTQKQLETLKISSKEFGSVRKTPNETFSNPLFEVVFTTPFTFAFRKRAFCENGSCSHPQNQTVFVTQVPDGKDICSIHLAKSDHDGKYMMTESPFFFNSDHYNAILLTNYSDSCNWTQNYPNASGILGFGFFPLSDSQFVSSQPSIYSFLSQNNLSAQVTFQIYQTSKNDTLKLTKERKYTNHFQKDSTLRENDVNSTPEQILCVTFGSMDFSNVQNPRKSVIFKQSPSLFSYSPPILNASFQVDGQVYAKNQVQMVLDFRMVGLGVPLDYYNTVQKGKTFTLILNDSRKAITVNYEVDDIDVFCSVDGSSWYYNRDTWVLGTSALTKLIVHFDYMNNEMKFYEKNQEKNYKIALMFAVFIFTLVFFAVILACIVLNVHKKNEEVQYSNRDSIRL